MVLVVKQILFLNNNIVNFVFRVCLFSSYVFYVFRSMYWFKPSKCILINVDVYLTNKGMRTTH